ncbi:MAG: hypothetical protein CMD72_04585 [Gammaproteobacteria bacterium]|nr:hypothetical protein [Gammaproteobacteria bacterium]
MMNDNNKINIGEPDLGIINLAVDKIDNSKLDELQLIVEEMVGKFPNGSTSWLFLSIFYNLKNNSIKAEEAIKNALKINPNYGEAHRIYSDILKKSGNKKAALEHGLISVRINPNNASALDTLGTAYASINDHQNAELAFKKGLNINPNLAVIHNNLGNTQRHLGKHNESINSLLKAKELSPKTIEIYNNLSITYFENQEYDKALDILKQTNDIKIINKENVVDLYTSYAHICMKIYQYKKAEEYYKKALSLNEDFSSANNGLGELFAKFCKHNKSIDYFEKSIRKSPKIENSISNYLLSFNYCLNKKNEEKYNETLKFAKLIKVFAKKNHKNIKDPNKKLKIGFVSGDFYNHPVAHFLLNPLKYLNDYNFETYAYNNYHLEDKFTKKLKKEFTYWRDIFALTDDKIFELLEDEEIDILFDLSGYTARNSIKIFKKKLSPIQISWLGYSGTLGLKEMDYILCDKIALPKKDEKWYFEKPLRMSNSYYCLSLPFKKNIKIEYNEKDSIVFGCFNNVKKLNDDVLTLWSKILIKIDNSILFLKFHDYENQEIRDKILEFFIDKNIPKERIVFSFGSSLREYLEDFNKIDISLDPFPYPGGTISCHSLYMGVPVITLEGNDFLSRNTENILINCKLKDFIAETKEQYIDIAINLAKNKRSLDKERIRKCFLNSPLVDGQSFSNELKIKLREVWKEYCKDE